MKRFIILFLSFLCVFSFNVYADTFEYLLGESEHNILEEAFEVYNRRYNYGGSGDTLSYKVSGEVKTWATLYSDKIVLESDTIKEVGKDKNARKGYEYFFTNVATLSKEEEVDFENFYTEVQEIDDFMSTVMMSSVFSNTKADIYSAYTITGPFMKVINFVLGIASVLIILALLIITVCDMCYIAFPVYRELLAFDKKVGNTRYWKSNRPPFISIEAYAIVMAREQLNTGGNWTNGVVKDDAIGNIDNVWLQYFLRRSTSYIVLALCIMYLVCGGISGIIAFVLNLTRGITG